MIETAPYLLTPNAFQSTGGLLLEQRLELKLTRHVDIHSKNLAHFILK